MNRQTSVVPALGMDRPPGALRGSSLASLVAELPPGSFALVMATGIVSIAAALHGLAPAAGGLLAFNLVAYAALLVLTVVRLIRFPSRVLADLRMPAMSAATLTAAAGTNVLGIQLVMLTGMTALPLVLWALGLLLWLVLGYVVVVALVVSTPDMDRVGNGTWMLLVVAPQSVAMLTIMLARHIPSVEFALGLALGAWLLGVGLYVPLIGVILSKWFLQPPEWQAFGPSLWIVMGAAAISAVTGAHLVLAQGEWAPLGQLAPFLLGATLLLWAMATWWIPLLVILAIWRHGVARVPLRYRTGIWAMVFPIGMYAVATDFAAAATSWDGLRPVATIATVVALVVWTVVFGSMVWEGIRLVRGREPHPATASPPGLVDAHSGHGSAHGGGSA
jgi:tellurite resistance protein TehA-like permease